MDIDGVTTMAKVAHMRLCHSRMPFLRAYPREAQEMVFDAHEKAFQFFKGACQRRSMPCSSTRSGRSIAASCS